MLRDLLNNFYTTYLDNILIYSDDPLEYKAHVAQVLERLRVVGL